MNNKIYISLISILFSFVSLSFAANDTYPQKVEIIKKSQANYFTPENTLSAIRSSLLAEDFNWADETMTQESLQEEIQQFKEAGIDRRQIIDLEKSIKESYIINKILYKDAVMLLVEGHGFDYSIQQVPLTFVKVNGLWKLTNKFSADPILLDHLDYISPDENLVADLKLNPSNLNYNWFVTTQKNMNKKGASGTADKNTILCMVSNIKDPLGNSYNASQIDINSILMNNVLKPQQWGEGNNQKLAVVVDNASKAKIKDKQALDTLNNSNGMTGNKSVLLVKFNQYQAMESLEDLAKGKIYEVIVSGKLTTGKYFRAKSTVSIK